jgi:hypothetical protein
MSEALKATNVRVNTPVKLTLVLLIAGIVQAAEKPEIEAYLDAFSADVQARLTGTRFIAEPDVRAAGVHEAPLPGKPGEVYHVRGGVFVPGATVEQIVQRVRDYDSHAALFVSSVRSARLCSKEDENTFLFRYRTSSYMEYVTETRATHHRPSPDRYAVVGEMTGTGSAGDLPDAAALCKGTPKGSSYMKALRSVWRYEQAAGGVHIETEIAAVLGGFTLARGIVRRLLSSMMKQSLEDYRTRFGPVWGD